MRSLRGVLGTGDTRATLLGASGSSPPGRVRARAWLTKVSPALVIALATAPVGLTGCEKHEEPAHEEQHKIVTTGALVKTITTTQKYVCQIHSQKHISVKALQDGYLQEIAVKEGQTVKKGDLLFRVLPTLYKARLDAELAEVQLAQLEYNNTKRLAEDKNQVVSQNEVALYQAKLAKAQAKADLARAELEFTAVKAPFDGIVDRLHEQLGSLVKKEDTLTTLSDNSTVWAYFNVPEVRYLEYMAGLPPGAARRNARIELANARIELVLTNGSKFNHDGGNVVTLEGEFNRETGNILFRSDLPNPDGLLRHGQAGNVLVQRATPDAVLIPQRATFEVLDKRYVFVVDKDNVVRQREVVVQHEMDDVFVIKSGVTVADKFVLEGVRQVRDGQKVEHEFRKPDEVMADQKKHAE